MAFPAESQYFAAHEFASPDLPGSGDQMDPVFIGKLNALRAAVGFPLRVTSGFRTAAHNRLVGGVDSSAHTTGHAADLAVTDSRQRGRLLHEAYRLGFTRVGVAHTFIHLDDADELPQDVTWVY